MPDLPATAAPAEHFGVLIVAARNGEDGMTIEATGITPLIQVHDTRRCCSIATTACIRPSCTTLTAISSASRRACDFPGAIRAGATGPLGAEGRAAVRSASAIKPHVGSNAEYNWDLRLASKIEQHAPSRVRSAEVTENPRGPTMFAVYSDQPELLESLRKLDTSLIQTGEIQNARRIEDPKLHLWDAALIAYQVVGVIGSIGGAVRFIDWVLEKVRDKKSVERKFQIEIGGGKIEISGDVDAEVLRESLSALLGTKKA